MPSTITATTDADGRFRLTGIGRDRIVELFVSGPKITTAQLYVLNRDGPAIRTTAPQAMMPEQTRTTYHARRFDYSAMPTKPIKGVIRDKDTGRPIAGVKLRGMVFKENSHVWQEGVETTTDAQGQYRLTGLPKGPAYRLFLEPDDGLPYTEDDLPGAGRVPSSGARHLRHRAEARHPGPGPGDGQSDRSAGLRICQRLHLQR